MRSKKLSEFLKAVASEQTRRLEKKQCPGCGKDMSNPKFRDELSRREAEISGFCQECQDKTFTPLD